MAVALAHYPPGSVIHTSPVSSTDTKHERARLVRRLLSAQAFQLDGLVACVLKSRVALPRRTASEPSASLFRECS